MEVRSKNKAHVRHKGSLKCYRRGKKGGKSGKMLLDFELIGKKLGFKEGF